MSTSGPDCATCIYRESCERAAEGTFCPKYQSEAPVYNEAEDPNVLWRRGEDTDF